jgi:hypothetical protein
LSRFALVLVAGAALSAFLPNLSWWLSLACCGWLIRDTRPTVRLLATWWLGLAILTPLYHPYARLWLPLEAAGWIVQAGLMAELRDLAFSGGGERDRGVRPSRFGARERFTVAVFVLAVWHDLGVSPRARPLPGLLSDTDGIRKAVSNLASGNRHVPKLLVMARPPVTFYLATTTRLRFSVVGSWRDLENSADPSEWAIVDEALLRQEPDRERIRMRLSDRWVAERSFPVVLNNPTLLDLDPGASFDASVDRRAPLTLYRARPR